MIKPEQIPDEVVQAFREAWMDADKTTEAAIAAAINAWPERIDTHPNNISHLVLQFKEKNND